MSGQDAHIISNLQKSSFQTSAVNSAAALQPRSTNLTEITSHGISNSGSLFQEPNSSLHPYDLSDSGLIAPQEPTFELSNRQFYESTYNGPGNLINGQRSGNALALSSGDVLYHPGDNRDSIHSDCFALDGVDCHCTTCESTKAPYQIGPIDNTPGNRYSNSSELLQDSQAFGTSDANSFTYQEFVPATFPQSTAYDSRQKHSDTNGNLTRTNSANSVPQIGHFPSYYHGRGQIWPGLLPSTDKSPFETHFGDGQISSHSAKVWNPQSSISADRPSSQTYLQRVATIPSQSSVEFSRSVSDNQVTMVQPDKASRQPIRRRRLKPYLSHPQESRKSTPETPAAIDGKLFLKSQEVLDKGATCLSDSQKEGLSKYLQISASQLEIFIEARREIKPILDKLASTSLKFGLQAELVSAWYLQTQPRSLSTNMIDSAYETNLGASPKRTRPAKRQKKTEEAETNTTPNDEVHPKPYQCTFISQDKSYCLQSTKEYGDWKRHEEKHYPPKRWICLLQGSSGDLSCYLCSEAVDLSGETSARPHSRCLKSDYRPAHSFLRRDKLLHHIKSEHGHTDKADVETWYQSLSANWKRQCGFCGEVFSDWEKRCRHVGPHFTNGKRMKPDWKDPWPGGIESPGTGPDDDQDIDHGHMNDRGFDSGDKARKDSEDPKHDSGTNGGNEGADDQNGHDRKDNRDSSSNRGGEQTHTGRKRKHGQQDNDHGKLSCFQNPNLIFRSVRKLGHGAFGIVDEIVHSRTSKCFARKTIRTSGKDSSIALTKVRKEVMALRQLSNEHIIKVLASYQTEDEFSIIILPIAECNLSEFLRHDNPRPAAQMISVSSWFGCLASALSYLHKKSWLHMDLKPQNILVSSGRVFLSDFGSARPMLWHSKGEMDEARCDVTPMYCAPEVLSRDASRFVTSTSDIYSLGCIYLEMATTLHRKSINEFEHFRISGTGDRSFNRNTIKSRLWIEHLWEICESVGLNVQREELLVISRMLNPDVDQRPSAHKLEKFYLKEYSVEEKRNNIEDYYAVRVNGRTFDPVTVASAWLKTCLRHHKLCSNQTVDFFPSRILNVGSKGGEIRLQPRRHEVSGRYVALSHRWSKGNVLETTSETLNERCLGIEYSALSADFQRAVRITQALGLHYLWIDSLCILQDSREDWLAESSRMHEIYGNSYLTIAILNEEQNSPTLDQKPVTKRLTRSDAPLNCPCCVRKSSAFKPLLEDSASTMLLDSPLSKRGWTLQERLLSPRVLHYSSTRLAWECGGGRLTFDATSRMRRSIGKVKKCLPGYFPPANFVCLDAPNPEQTPMIRKIWRDIVREYSKRQLTISSDKLPALAGLAATMNAICRCQYLAGLWDNDLKHGLLWSRDHLAPLTVRPEYRAPSWSWAAIDSQVEWPKSILELPEDSNTTILSCSTVLRSKISPFGGVSDGHIRISGLMRQATIVSPYSETLVDAENREPFAFGLWDALDGTDDKNCKRTRIGFQLKELWCIQVLDGVGLVVKECEPKYEGRFERVGIYWIRVDSGIEELLSGGFWEQRTITLI